MNIKDDNKKNIKNSLEDFLCFNFIKKNRFFNFSFGYLNKIKFVNLKVNEIKKQQSIFYTKR
jgi:hypothetical protein